MSIPHRIVCLTGISCPDRYCEGEIVIRLMDYSHGWYEVAFSCQECGDVWIDRSCIEWYA